MAKDQIVLRPQPGPQEAFLSSPADIVIYGGAAGGGKTFGLLLDPVRHVTSVPRFNAVFFRRTTPQITNPGGLWDASVEMYSKLKGKPTPHVQEWCWPNGGDIKMSHLEHDKTVYNWQGTEICAILFDELTHFTADQFWYMISRNRSTCGVRPYVRATTNPDPDSWVAEFIDWWIDGDGFPIPERSGKLRWFHRANGVLHWADTAEELIEQFPGIDEETGLPLCRPKSVTFISAKLTDNKELMRRDPDYITNLRSLPRVEQARLLGGNWKVRKEDGSMFPQSLVTMLKDPPNDVVAWVRRWDLAATKPSEVNPDPDATAGVLMGMRRNGRVVFADMQWMREDANKVRTRVQETGKNDKRRFKRVFTLIPIDPGQAGKDQLTSYQAQMHGFRLHGVKETGDKETRAEPLSATWNGGMVDVVEGPWNQKFFAEMAIFPSKNAHDDIVDAASGGYNALTGRIRSIRKFLALAS